MDPAKKTVSQLIASKEGLANTRETPTVRYEKYVKNGGNLMQLSANTKGDGKSGDEFEAESQDQIEERPGVESPERR